MFFTVLSVFLLTFLIVIIVEYPRWMMSLFTAYVASIVAVVAVVVLALPLHTVLSRLNKTSALWYVLAGAITGPFFVLVFKPFGNDLAKDLVVQTFICGSLGAMSAIVFWFFAVYRHRLTRASN